MSAPRQAMQMALGALENCTSEHGHRCNRCDSEVDEGRKVIEALRASPSAQQEPAKRDREADRQRFSDPYFNRWLDEGISDSGHTVWDVLGDVCDAWHWWSNQEFYTHQAPTVQPLTDEQLWNAVKDCDVDSRLQAGRAAISEFCRINGIGG